MSVVDLAVIAVVVLAALRGARRGGTGLVLRAGAATAGVLALGALARWYDPTSTPLGVGAALVGALLGWAVGRRVAHRLATRADGRHRAPGLPDRALGVVVHAAFALVVCVALGATVAAVGPASAARAADSSGLLTAAGERLPAPTDLFPPAAGSVR